MWRDFCERILDVCTFFYCITLKPFSSECNLNLWWLVDKYNCCPCENEGGGALKVIKREKTLFALVWRLMSQSYFLMLSHLFRSWRWERTSSEAHARRRGPIAEDCSRVRLQHGGKRQDCDGSKRSRHAHGRVRTTIHNHDSSKEWTLDRVLSVSDANTGTTQKTFPKQAW